jgi:hypothetical protein
MPALLARLGPGKLTDSLTLAVSVLNSKCVCFELAMGIR